MTRKHITRIGLAIVVVLAVAPVMMNTMAQEYPAGMVSYWRLDEGNGTIAGDSASGNNGAIYGAVWATGKVDDALSCDGVDDYVSLPDVFPPGNASRSIEAWFKLNETALPGGVQGRIHPIAGWGSHSPGQASYLAVYENQNGAGSCGVFFWAERSDYDLRGVTELVSDVWYHAVVTYDGSTLKLYLNGEFESSKNVILNTSQANSMIGDAVAQASFDGAIDEVAIYNRPLAPEEIQQHYQNGLAGLGYDLPSSATIIASPSASELYPGDPLAADLNIVEASDLYAVQVECSIDPSILEPQSGDFSPSFFDPVNCLILANDVDAATGTWLGVISQANPAGPLSGDGLFATVNYQALAPGITPITCEVLLSDRDGFLLPVTFTGAEVTVLPYASIDGVVTYQGRLAHAEIDIVATGPVTRTSTTDVTGSFTLNELRAGTYDVVADASGYLPVCTTQALNPGDEITLATTALTGGDVNDDNVINIGDATLIGNNFGLDVPPGDAAADINADSIVNVQDLAILGGNYELAGCQSW